MAVKPRLAAPRVRKSNEWVWHQANCGSFSVDDLARGQRRMEASSYLAPGYLVRKAMATSGNTMPLSSIATPWMPKRLKGIRVDEANGVPFLAATQLLDRRPRPRKWLSKRRTPGVVERFVEPGSILLTVSGTVGRTTISSEAQAGCIVTHDLMRFRLNAAESTGWLYAYLLSNQARAMMLSSHYGHIIKHLEIEHMVALPVPRVSDDFKDECQHDFEKIHNLRSTAQRLQVEAEARYSAAVGFTGFNGKAPGHVELNASELFRRSRRLDAEFYSSETLAIRALLASKDTASIAELGYRAWLPNRFVRIHAKNGVGLLESGALFEANPDIGKYISDKPIADEFKGRAKPDWILLARSGQKYGIIGQSRLAGTFGEDVVVSDHVIRIADAVKPKILPGALLTAISHPALGIPLMKALASGSSVPAIDPSDIEAFEIPILKENDERFVHEKQVAAQNAWDEADRLERNLGSKATAEIARLTGAIA